MDSYSESEQKVYQELMEMPICNLPRRNLQAALDINPFFEDIVHTFDFDDSEWDFIKCSGFGSGKTHRDYLDFLRSTKITVTELHNALKENGLDEALQALSIIMETTDLEKVRDLRPSQRFRIADNLKWNAVDPTEKCWEDIAKFFNHAHIIDNIKARTDGIYSKGDAFIRMLIGRNIKISVLQDKLEELLKKKKFEEGVQPVYDAFHKEVQKLLRTTVMSANNVMYKATFELNFTLRTLKSVWGPWGYLAFKSRFTDDDCDLNSLLTLKVHELITNNLMNSEITEHDISVKIRKIEIKDEGNYFDFTMIFRPVDGSAIPEHYVHAMTRASRALWQPMENVIRNASSNDIYKSRVHLKDWDQGCLTLVISLSKNVEEIWERTEIDGILQKIENDINSLDLPDSLGLTSIIRETYLCYTADILSHDEDILKSLSSMEPYFEEMVVKRTVNKRPGTTVNRITQVAKTDTSLLPTEGEGTPEGDITSIHQPTQ